MQAAGNPIQVRELVPAIVGRLPAILTEVRELLSEQQSDYAAFLAEGIEEVLGAAEGFIARLIGMVDRDPSTMAPRLASSAEQALFEEIGCIHYQQQRDLTPSWPLTGPAPQWPGDT